MSKVKIIKLPDRSEGNTRVTVPSLGNVELKFISGGDSQRFAKIVFSATDYKLAATEILHSQLLKPSLSLEQFRLIPEKDMLKILQAFVKNEDFSFKHFDKQKQPYEAFIDALKLDYRKRAEELSKLFAPRLDALSKAMNEIAKQYKPINISPSIHESISRAIQQTSTLVSPGYSFKFSTDFSRSLLAAQESAMKSITSLIAPQAKVWESWAKTNTDMFSGTFKVLREFHKTYKIAEQEAIVVMAKYKWFVSPSIPITLIYKVQQINKRKGNQRKAVNDVFIKYFERNHWEALDVLLEEWKDNPLFSSRYKILKDTFNLIQLGSRSDINIVNATLPTLIVQIDGILKDFMRENISVSFNDHTKIKTLKESGLVQPASELEELGVNVFLDILFQSSNPGTPLKTPFNLNRHKIIHAEKIKYGRKDYLIRVIMVLDILAHMQAEDTEDSTE